MGVEVNLFQKLFPTICQDCMVSMYNDLASMMSEHAEISPLYKKAVAGVLFIYFSLTASLANVGETAA